MTAPSSIPGPSVTSRVFAILDAFAPGEARLTLSQISRRTGLPIATTHRLAAELVRVGGLERDTRGSYRIGFRLWEIGSLASVRGGLTELAIPFMEDLYEATHENVQLAVRTGLEALFLEKINGRNSIQIVTRVGGRLPLHATGVGKILLAYAPPEIVDAVIERGLERYAPRTIVEPAELRRCLEEIRRTGIGLTRDEMTPGSMSVAAPVYGPPGTVVAALSVVASSRVTDVGRIAPIVQTAARGLSRRVAEAWDRVLPDESAWQALGPDGL